MKQTIEALVNGKHEIVEFYQRACEHWKEILQQTEPLDDSTLAKRLLTGQHWFEQHCGDKYLGQEIMVMTGIAQFYSTWDGFGENVDKAKMVMDALNKCGSIEAEGLVEIAAKIYDLP